MTNILHLYKKGSGRVWCNPGAPMESGVHTIHTENLRQAVKLKAPVCDGCVNSFLEYLTQELAFKTSGPIVVSVMNDASYMWEEKKAPPALSEPIKVEFTKPHPKDYKAMYGGKQPKVVQETYKFIPFPEEDQDQ